MVVPRPQPLVPVIPWILGPGRVVPLVVPSPLYLHHLNVRRASRHGWVPLVVHVRRYHLNIRG